jgi:FPC/CPF motif-containing protein YcgG
MTLLSKDDIERLIKNSEFVDWKETRYRSFQETMTDSEKPYPCFFAVEAQKKGYFRYSLPGDPTSESSLATLADDLAEFVDIYSDIGEYPAIVILFEPPETEQSAESYKTQFWNVLSYLQEVDPEPWPATVPTDPEHPKWEYCFAGEPLFVVGRAPFYDARRSRYTPHGLEITMQPGGVFDDLTGLDDTGQEARTIIRERQAEYDDIDRHPDIGDLVDPRARQWKQFLLPETNEESVVRCPLPERTDVKGRTDSGE